MLVLTKATVSGKHNTDIHVHVCDTACICTKSYYRREDIDKLTFILCVQFIYNSKAVQIGENTNLIQMEFRNKSTDLFESVSQNML